MFSEEWLDLESVLVSFGLSSGVDLQMLLRESKLLWVFAVDVEDLSAWLI